MNNIGFFGTKLNSAAHKVLNAKTPEEANFRNGLLHNDKAREVVDTVDFVKNSMTALDGKGVDLDTGNQSVRVDTQTKNPGFLARSVPEFAGRVKGIAAQAPSDGSESVSVSGTLKGEELSVNVKSDKGQNTTISKNCDDDGSVVYRSGDEVVKMNSDGTLSMSTAPEPPKNDHLNAWWDSSANSMMYRDHGGGGTFNEIVAKEDYLDRKYGSQ